jgi:L-asparaginase
MEEKNKLHFILTGGTIDSYYDAIKGTAIPNEHSAIPKFIKTLKLYEECEFTEVFMKDSRDLNEPDRKKILDVVQNSNCKRIIVTHGSYTLSETAKYLSSNINDMSKVIIFTCSMIPLEGFSPTDAGFNLGYAVAMSQELTNGIYACMNGRIFSPEEVTKILSEGRFGSIYTK